MNDEYFKKRAENKRKSLIFMIRNSKQDKVKNKYLSKSYCTGIICTDCFYYKKNIEGRYGCFLLDFDDVTYNYEEDYIKEYGEVSLIEELL